MRVYDIRDQAGRVFAFEVSSTFLLRRGAIRVASKIPGSRVTWRPSIFPFGLDVFCKFEIEGTAFKISEDFGDSSRFWIGPDPPRWVPQTERVREAFLSARPSPFW
jgi:hypothetical protein